MSDSRLSREEYEATGMLRQALPLSDPCILAPLLADVSVFGDAIADLHRRGVTRRVPYILTDAIRRAASDSAILRTVSAILGANEPWVMWVPNIREDVPNQAGCWHVDCESVRWPTISVVVGLAGCHDGNATRYIPGSHRLRLHPEPRPSEEGPAMCADARAVDARCGPASTFAGFGDSRFYVFDAGGWHCGDPAASAGRKLLFLHYQRASAPRIPYMRDYEKALWFDYPAAYMSGDGKANRALYALPSGGDQSTTTLRGLLYRWRHGVAAC